MGFVKLSVVIIRTSHGLLILSAVEVFWTWSKPPDQLISPNVPDGGPGLRGAYQLVFALIGKLQVVFCSEEQKGGQDARMVPDSAVSFSARKDQVGILIRLNVCYQRTILEDLVIAHHISPILILRVNFEYFL